MTSQPRPFVKGLDGVVAVQTELSSVDGTRGILTYRGINIHELAESASYEEVCYLLFFGKLPTSAELDGFNTRLRTNRVVPEAVFAVLRALPHDAIPMDALRTALSTLACTEPDVMNIDHDATQLKALKLVAQFPTIVAAFQRIREGKEPIAPRTDLGQAANFLYMLNGQEPDTDFARALDMYFVLLADHGMNASTFTSRVVASTNADVHTAVTAAIAALKGPLHGGANEATMKMLLEVGEIDKVDEFVDHAFATKRKIMGFGHRIYKTGDPRATHLQARARKLGEKLGQIKYVEMSLLLEKAILRHKELYPNVDYFSAPMLYYVGVPIDLFTPMFACSRMAGWCAHVLEQHKDAVLIRPQSEYVGPQDQHYVAVDQRG